MKLNEMKLDDLLYMNLHMLSKKLFNIIDYKEVKKEHFTLTEKEKTGYKGVKGPTGRYEKILNSKANDKEKALNKLYNDFYDLADEYIKELDQYKCFLSEDYLNRVETNLKPTMKHYITKILNK